MKRIALAAAPLILAALTFAPSASADHGHNCVWSGGAWVGQGLCPGMPGFVPHTATPTAEPSPTEAPAPTTPPATPSPTSTAPSPTSTAPAPTATVPGPTSPGPGPVPTATATPTSTRTGCLRSYGNEWCTGATPSTSTTTPAPVVTGPVVDTDIPYEHRNHPRGW